MRKTLSILSLCAALSAVAGTDITPNPSSPGNLGDATNAFPNIYGTNIYGAFIGNLTGNAATATVLTGYAADGSISNNVVRTNSNLNAALLVGTVPIGSMNTGLTNGWPWTNLTVAHAGAVTNGYPWTNVPVASATTASILTGYASDSAISNNIVRTNSNLNASLLVGVVPATSMSTVPTNDLSGVLKSYADTKTNALGIIQIVTNSNPLAVSVTGNATTATTATNVVYTTNSVANLNLVTFSLTSAGNYANYSTNDNIVITGLGNVNASANTVQWAVRFYTNTSGATKTITLPASFIGVNATEYLTNQGVLSIVLYPGVGTNAVWRCLK